jgi:hypothetical protein
MNDEPRDDESVAESEQQKDWAEEIKRLRAASGQRLADRLAEDPEKEPPIA